MWAAIIGKRSPRATTIGASTPVKDVGRTTCSGTAHGSAAVGGVVPVDAEEVPGIGRVRLDAASPARAAAGIDGGSISWEKVGRIVRVSRNRRTVRS